MILDRSVVAGGVIFAAGTSREDAEGVPDGPWWVEGATESGSDAVAEPPRSGKGSGVNEWRKYAEQVGVSVPDGASRDDIVELIDAR